MESWLNRLGEGIGFATPLLAEGRVIVTYDSGVGVFGLRQ
jgi:hypothetical protein